MGRARQQRALDMMGALIEGGNRLIRRRPSDLGTFLAALDTAPAADLLTTTDGRRDAEAHLGTSWQATVTALARPDSLPQVVERRNRARVHPAAPWATAGVAAAGSGVLVAGSLAAPLEVLGVAGIAVVSALGAGWAWRPRPSRADRRHTLTGSEAMAARGQALLAAQTSPDPEVHRATQRAHGLLLGHVDDVHVAERTATEAGLLDPDGHLIGQATLTPAHRAMIDDLLLQRAELAKALLALQHLGLRIDEDERRSRRDAYRRLLDDPLEDL